MGKKVKKLKEKAKKNIEERKREASKRLNEVLGTNIDFSKLSLEELEQLVLALDNLVRKAQSGGFGELKRLKILLAGIGYRLFSAWQGPIASIFADIFKDSLEKEGIEIEES